MLHAGFVCAMAVAERSRWLRQQGRRLIRQSGRRNRSQQDSGADSVPVANKSRFHALIVERFGLKTSSATGGE